MRRELMIVTFHDSDTQLTRDAVLAEPLVQCHGPGEAHGRPKLVRGRPLDARDPLLNERPLVQSACVLCPSSGEAHHSSEAHRMKSEHCQRQANPRFDHKQKLSTLEPYELSHRSQPQTLMQEDRHAVERGSRYPGTR
jgi:hypothetical protein